MLSVYPTSIKVSFTLHITIKLGNSRNISKWYPHAMKKLQANLPHPPLIFYDAVAFSHYQLTEIQPQETSQNRGHQCLHERGGQYRSLRRALPRYFLFPTPLIHSYSPKRFSNLILPLKINVIIAYLIGLRLPRLAKDILGSLFSFMSAHVHCISQKENTMHNKVNEFRKYAQIRKFSLFLGHHQQMHARPGNVHYTYEIFTSDSRNCCAHQCTIFCLDHLVIKYFYNFLVYIHTQKNSCF